MLSLAIRTAFAITIGAISAQSSIAITENIRLFDPQEKLQEINFSSIPKLEGQIKKINKLYSEDRYLQAYDEIIFAINHHQNILKEKVDLSSEELGSTNKMFSYVYFIKALVIHEIYRDNLSKQHTPADIFTSLNKAINLNPNESYFYAFKGLMHMFQGDLNEAMTDSSIAIHISPRSNLPWLLRGIIWTSMDQLDLAIKDLDRAIKLAPCETSYFVRGALHIKLSEWKLAKNDVTSAIEASIENPSATYYLTRAQIYTQLREQEKAIRDYKSAIAIEPEDPGIKYMLASFLSKERPEHLEDLTQAAELLRESCELTQWIRGDYVIELAYIHHKLGNSKESQLHANKFIKIATDEEKERSKKILAECLNGTQSLTK